MMRVISAAFQFALFFLPLATPAKAEQPVPSGTVTGELRIDEKTIPLTHVYAREVWQIPPRSPNELIDPYISVTITDREVPPEFMVSDDLSWKDDQQRLVQRVTVVLEPRKGEIRHLSYIFKVATDELPRVKGGNGDWLSKYIGTIDFDYDGQLLTAKFKSLAPESDRVDLDVSFATHVVQAPKILAILEGDEARRSGPARAYLEYFDSYRPMLDRQLDVIALGQCGTQSPSCVETIRSKILATIPSQEAVLESVQGVVMFEHRAIVWFESSDNNTRSGGQFECVEEDGIWVPAHRFKN